MTAPFRELHHVCVVVRDIDQSVAYYESIGIGPWQDYPPPRRGRFSHRLRVRP